MFSQKEMSKCLEHASRNPITSRGRTSISRMAALITDGKKYRVFGRNQYKTHPLVLKFSKDQAKICLHAEMDALIKCIWDAGYSNNQIPSFLEDLDIYIARVLKDGTPALAKPCDTCYGALTYFGIRNIYYTGDLNGSR